MDRGDGGNDAITGRRHAGVKNARLGQKGPEATNETTLDSLSRFVSVGFS